MPVGRWCQLAAAPATCSPWPLTEDLWACAHTPRRTWSTDCRASSEAPDWATTRPRARTRQWHIATRSAGLDPHPRRARRCRRPLQLWLAARPPRRRLTRARRRQLAHRAPLGPTATLDYRRTRIRRSCIRWLRSGSPRRVCRWQLLSRDYPDCSRPARDLTSSKILRSTRRLRGS